MSKNTKKTIKNVVFVAFFAVLVVAFVVCYNLYRSYCGCFVVPSEEIKLSQMADNTISVMSYNIKRDYVAQNQEEAENSWQNRAKLVSSILNEYKPAIVGLQEVRLSQEFYLSRYLSGFDSVVQYRDSSLFAESNPIFYRNDMFSLIKSETFWLSETPQNASVSWGSNCFRICTIAILKDKRTQKSLVVANTHLDNSNGEIRLKQAQVILNKIKQYNLPTLLMGDMNSGSYSNTISEVKTQMTDMGAGYDDENAVTFNNLDKNYKNSGIKIDWIFQSKDSFAVNKYAVITKNFDGKFPSDHFPIYAEFIQN